MDDLDVLHGFSEERVSSGQCPDPGQRPVVTIRTDEPTNNRLGLAVPGLCGYNDDFVRYRHIMVSPPAIARAVLHIIEGWN